MINICLYKSSFFLRRASLITARLWTYIFLWNHYCLRAELLITFVIHYCVSKLRGLDQNLNESRGFIFIH